MKAEDKVKQRLKELSSAQERYSERVVDYHLMALIPTQNDEAMTATLDYYTTMVIDFLKLMYDFRKYYQNRKVVDNTFVSNLLRVSDEVEKMLDIHTADLSYLDGDYGPDSKTK